MGRRSAVVAFVLTAALVPCAAQSSAGAATPPPNDDPTKPEVITALPYSHEQDTTEATDDHVNGCNQPIKAVFFRYRAERTGTLYLDTHGSSYRPVTTVYKGSATLGQIIACFDPLIAPGQEGPFPVIAGTTYEFMVSGEPAEATSGHLVFELRELHDELIGSLKVKQVAADGKGTATVTVTISCSAPIENGSVDVGLWQRKDSTHETSGTAQASVDRCSKAPTTVRVPLGGAGPFRPGPAYLRVHALVCAGLHECSVRDLDGIVRIVAA